MTLVLKSDRFAKNRIASSLFQKIPSDWTRYADFVSGQYNINGSQVNAQDLISTLRTSQSGYKDADGNYKTAPPNSLRIHHDDHIGKGAIVEGGVTNLLQNPSAPASQTIAFNLTNDRYIVAQVWGPGSARFVIDGKFDVVVTESTPFVFKNTGAIAANLVVTVTGTLSHFQVFETRYPSPCVTKLNPNHAVDYNYFSVPDLRKFTIVISRRLMKKYISEKLGNAAYPFIQMLFKTTGYLGINDTDGPTANKKEIFGTVLTGNVLFGNKISDDENEILVWSVDLDNKKTKVCQNANTVHTLDITGTIPSDVINRIVLGGGVVSPYNNSMSQIFKEAYFYDRILSDQEMKAIF